ncbi:MAG: NAD(P)-dependent oxidoreductase, partial [Armatimonadota bacterium]|nr:NAD(P)-dependent oxidoreductase [Armatimonadota bacterium]
RERLRRMKPTAVLVNTCRGAVVDEAALVDALREGWIWAAGLDVFDREPLPPDSPLLSLDNVVLLPHIGSASFATRARMSEMAAENCVAVLSGRRPPNPVNPEVLDRLG